MVKWLNDNGTLNTAALDELAANLKAVTDSHAMLDQVVKNAKIGVPTIPAFKCNHSGLYFPPDYAKAWGKLYGLGLGPDPVSEILDTDYDTDPPAITPEIDDISQIMHPVGHTRVQMDLVMVPQDEYNANLAIPAHTDHKMKLRAPILRAKQLANTKGKLRVMQAAWERGGR